MRGFLSGSRVERETSHGGEGAQGSAGSVELRRQCRGFRNVQKEVKVEKIEEATSGGVGSSVPWKDCCETRWGRGLKT